ncbi:MAG: proline dehydrogenase family protein, partial [Phycisphaerae bacterium]|nr:proline dehydrogenase family protein [Phycisphaerae bacterium]
MLETRIRAIGHDLFSRIRRRRGAGGLTGWIDQKLMEFSMRDEQLKAQLFRFVDVLPVLRETPAINRHLKEYLGKAGSALPEPVRDLIDAVPESGLTASLIAQIAQINTRRMARRFIAASDLDEAVRTILTQRRQKLAFTIDLLGEAVVSASEAEQHQQTYLQLVQGLAARLADEPILAQVDLAPEGPIPRVNVSVKLSSLFSQFDPIDPENTWCEVSRGLRPILRAARANGALINLDMEQYAFKEATIDIFKRVLMEPEFRDWPDAGIAIQAYLRCSLQDLEQLRDFAKERGTPIHVRLVKGAYWDYETVIAAQNGWPTPVFTRKPETDANFEKSAAFLMENSRYLRPAIASHNVRSIAAAIAHAERCGLPSRSYEFQMLYGMAEPIRQTLVDLGHRVRIYTPFGRLLPGMAYLVRRLLENTSNESFLRAGFVEKVPEEQLLANPAEANGSPVGNERTPRNGQRASGDWGPTMHQKKIRHPPQADENGMETRFVPEPPSDFSRAEVRQQMRQALVEVRARLGRTYPLVIGGQRIGDRPKTLDSLNPSARTELVGRAVAATPEDADRAVFAAQEAFGHWRNVPAPQRAELLQRVAQIMRRRRFELAAWMILECAKPWREADADVAEAIDFCDFYAGEMIRLAASPRWRNVPGEENYMIYEPRGVCAVIAPWNFPLAILTGMTAAAVVTGNTAVMKPAEQSPVIAYMLMEIFEEAGAPAGVVNYLPGVGEEVGPVLVRHRNVPLIVFTGSQAVGLAINRDAAQTPPGQHFVKRVITEMGGKNAIIVDEDADLDEAVVGVVHSAFGFAGQKCSACSRAIVLQNVYDQFVPRLIEATRSLKIGPAEEPSTFVPPVIDDEAAARI